MHTFKHTDFFHRTPFSYCSVNFFWNLFNQEEVMTFGGRDGNTVVRYDTCTGFVFNSITALGLMALAGRCSLNLCILVLFYMSA